jgi:hypothetical protein
MKYKQSRDAQDMSEKREVVHSWNEHASPIDEFAYLALFCLSSGNVASVQQSRWYFSLSHWTVTFSYRNTTTSIKYVTYRK